MVPGNPPGFASDPSDPFCPEWWYDSEGNTCTNIPSRNKGETLKFEKTEEVEGIYDCGPVTPAQEYEGPTKIFFNDAEMCAYYRQKDGSWFSPNNNA